MDFGGLWDQLPRLPCVASPAPIVGINALFVVQSANSLRHAETLPWCRPTLRVQSCCSHTGK